MELSILLQATVDALMMGLFYILVALGLTIVFGILRAFNFAHGEVYMLGGFAAYYLFGQFHLNFFLTIALGAIGGGAIGLILDRLIFRPFRSEPFNAFIASLGVVWILQTIAAVCFGVVDKPVPSPFPGIIRVAGVTISFLRFATTLIGAALVVALYLFIQWTKTGKAMRALAQDREAASIQGINVDFICAIAFCIGSALAVIAGVLMAPVFVVNPYIGSLTIVKAFMVIILGGMGSIPGAVLGGLIFGFVESFAFLRFGSGVVLIMGFIIIIVVLLIKPTGILGHD